MIRKNTKYIHDTLYYIEKKSADGDGGVKLTWLTSSIVRILDQEYCYISGIFYKEKRLKVIV